MSDITVEIEGTQQPVELRFLCSEDIPILQKLCREWFPIIYPNDWYEYILTNSNFYALAATLCTNIVGLIIAEIKTQSDCYSEDSGILSKHFQKETPIAYILILGTVKEYRRNGIASMLIDKLIYHLTNNNNFNHIHCKAIFLHVLTTNTIAINFYERLNFRKHRYLPFYYCLDSEERDGYSYVLYINGGHPPWPVFVNTDSISPLYYSLSSINPWKLIKRIAFKVISLIVRYLPSYSTKNIKSHALSTC